MLRRIRVVGTSGSGKTRMARQLSHRLDLPYLELDALHHRADWTEAPTVEFRAAVQRAIDIFESNHGGWIVDGNYAKAADLLEGADTMVWLDYPRHIVMSRMLRRTFGRMALRTSLWHGNRERWRWLFSRDPEKNIVLWAWTRYPMYREQYEEESSRDDGRIWIRLEHPRDAQRWVAAQHRTEHRPSAMG